MSKRSILDILLQVQKISGSDKNYYDELILIKDYIRKYLDDVIKLPYTIHNWDHSEKVAQLCTELIPERILIGLKPIELFLLILAFWLHDGGMVPDHPNQSHQDIRDNHHLTIKRRIEEDELPFISKLDPITRHNLAQICYSHRLPTLDDISKESFIDLERINLRLLCAILRLCDVCDISFNRTPWFIFNNFIFEEKDLMHWKKHQLIQGFNAIWNETTKFCLHAEFASEQDLKYIINAIESIEIELKIIIDIFKLNGYIIDPFIERCIRERNPDSQKFITVLPKNIYKILIENLYENPDVFIREMMQNSIDAVKIQKKICQNERDKPYNPQISVDVFYKEKKGKRLPYAIKVSDNGLGMNQSDVQDFLLEIGTGIKRSEQIMEILQSGESPEKLIAEFGIGFLSCFAVSEKIIVNTKKDNFLGLEIEFPDFSHEYSKISERRIKIRRDEDLVSNGTSIALYLNEARTNLDPQRALKKYCRNIDPQLIYEEHKFESDKDIWKTVSDGGKCKRIGRRFLGEDAIDRAEIRLDDTNYCEGFISFEPKSKENKFYICQDGIFVENCIDLLPKDIVGIQGEINVKPGNIKLTASRNRVVRNKEFGKLKKIISNYLDILIFNYMSKNKMYSISNDGNMIYDLLNSRYQSLKTNKRKLSNFFTSVENGILIAKRRGDYCTLCEFREILNNKHKKVYQIIEHGLYYTVGLSKEMDRYRIDFDSSSEISELKEMLVKECGGEAFITTLVPLDDEPSFLNKCIRRDFFKAYFENNGFEIIQLEPFQWSDLLDLDDVPRDLAKMVTQITEDKYKFINGNINARCIIDSDNIFLNLGHPSILKILNMFKEIETRFGGLDDDEQMILKMYINLVTFKFDDALDLLEEYLKDLAITKKFLRREKLTDELEDESINNYTYYFFDENNNLDDS